MNEEEQEVRAAVKRLVGDDEDEIQRMLARYEGCHTTVRGFFRMRGTFVSDDFYCGQVTGELLLPLQASLDGSTFAAVRIDDPMELPLDVPINCFGDTVTDS